MTAGSCKVGQTFSRKSECGGTVYDSKKINVPKMHARRPRIKCFCGVRDIIRSVGISVHVVKEKNINRISAGGSNPDKY